MSEARECLNAEPRQGPFDRRWFYVALAAAFLWCSALSGCGPCSSKSPKKKQNREEDVGKWEKKAEDKKEKTPPTPGILVAGDQGVRLVSLKGESLHVLSKTPAMGLRILPGTPQRAVFLGKKDGTLRVLDLASGKEETVTKVPDTLGINCGGIWGKAYNPSEFIHADRDLLYDPVKKQICMVLGDRNENMRNVEVRVRIDLAGKPGRVQHSLTMPGSCKKPEKSIPKCRTTPTKRAKAKADQGKKWPFYWKSAKDFVENRVPKEPHGEPKYTLRKDNFGVDARSPSGRWVVLSGNIEGGDYIYRQVVLLDQKTGEFFPVKKGAASGKPLNPLSLEEMRAMQESTTAITGETRLAWLEKRDLLLVGELLVEPGKKASPLGGHPAMRGTRLSYPVCLLKGKKVTCP